MSLILSVGNERRSVAGAIFAVDYDGTVADTNAAKTRWIRTNIGREVFPWQCSRTDCVPLIGEEAYERMGNCVYELDSTLNAAEVPGAAAALEALAKVGKVYVISARLPRRLEYARQWLARRSLLSFTEAVMTSHGSSKIELCRAVGANILIDDDLRHLVDVRLSGLTGVWLQHGRTDFADGPSDVACCSSWDEVKRRLLPPG